MSNITHEELVQAFISYTGNANEAIATMLKCIEDLQVSVDLLTSDYCQLLERIERLERLNRPVSIDLESTKWLSDE